MSYDIDTRSRELVRAFGYVYDERPTSGIGKLLYPYLALEELETETIEAIRDSRYLETAFGYSLDLIGDQIRCGRQVGQTDESYRTRLRLEIMVLTSAGTVEEVREILAEALEISPSQIQVTNNASPSQALEGLPFFVEVSLNYGAFLLGGGTQWFKFSDQATASAFDSPYGFGRGKWRGDGMTPETVVATISYWLERILATGVQYVIAVHGGFKFSDHATTDTLDSDRGFGQGKWSGVLSS
jgi:hypothetical protein